jgi:hypothetical protein
LRILVLVLGARVRPYPLLAHVIGRTWASMDVADVDALFYDGGADRARLDGRRLALPVADDLPNVGRKTLACFEYVLANRDFDLVFRTNCSSYVDLPNLREYALGHARVDRFYAGSVRVHDGVQFASGSGYFLSRDLVELAVRQRAEWDHSLLDDVALGAIVARAGVEPAPLPRHDYATLADARDADTSQFHFRCKTYSWQRLEDARIMIAVHRAFCESRGLPFPGELRALALLGRLGSRAAHLVGLP